MCGAALPPRAERTTSREELLLQTVGHSKHAGKAIGLRENRLFHGAVVRRRRNGCFGRPRARYTFANPAIRLRQHNRKLDQAASVASTEMPNWIMRRVRNVSVGAVVLRGRDTTVFRVKTSWSW
jgi:hypothetical protein